MAYASDTIVEEIRVGRRHSPEIAWPTIRLAVGVYLFLALGSWSALSGSLPIWVGMLINTITLYAAYTVIHEATHNNIVPRIQRLRWMNQFMGFMICIPLWMFFYPHKKSHMVHHAKCNTDEDPDIYARGPFGVVTFWRTPLLTLNYLNPRVLYQDCRRYKLTRTQELISYLTFALYTTAAAAAIVAGYGREFLLLWLIPFVVGNTVMLTFFTWIPHHPHTETSRYRNTRCSVWPGANFLTQGQHMHLIHHMMTWIPYYQYEQVFREIRPCLERNDVMIDGFWPRPVTSSQP